MRELDFPDHEEVDMMFKARPDAGARVPQEVLLKDPWDLLNERYILPFPPKPHQEANLREHGRESRFGYGWKPGTGKSYGTATHALYLKALNAARQWVILVPPIVIRNWSRFLGQIIDRRTGKPVTQLVYAGTPLERKGMKLNAEFILMSYSIFLRDFERISDELGGGRTGLISDEAHKIKNMQTASFKGVWQLFSEAPTLLATGTPISSPDDAYTFMKFTNPGAYRNKRHFEQMHVGERDDYEKVISWENTDVLQANFRKNWSFYEPEYEHKPNFIPIVYDLDKKHLQLYDQLVEEQLVELDDGRVIDALNASALYHRCQQIVNNWAHFTADPSKVSAGFELMEGVLDEIGNEKLIVVANYRLTTTSAAKHFAALNPAVIIGGLSDKQRFEQVDKFLSSKSCRLAIIQPEAGGVGLDGLQHVCNEMLFLECPTVPRQFEQAYARLYREGQKRRVNIRIAVANRTVQVGMHRRLLENDDTIVKVTGGIKTLREAIHGE